jgi:chondroitin AC lyase
VASISGSKAAFFLDGYAVFLGAGLSFSKTDHVITTVNQQIANGTTWIQRKGSAPAALGAAPQDVVGSDIQSVWHDSVGYVFPTPAATEITIGDSTGTWSSIDTHVAAKTDAVTETLFNVWLDHGTSAASASYAYAIVPGIGQSDLAAWASAPPYSVEQNTSAVQAVLAQSKTWHGAVFHQAGSLTYSDGLYLASDIPCAVILRATTDSFYLSVADPAHRAATANLTVSVPLAGNGASWNATTSRSTIAVPLPLNGQDTGKTVVIGFRKVANSTGLSNLPNPAIEPSLVRNGNRLTVRNVPTGITHVTLVDLRGKVLNRWPASAATEPLELTSMEGPAFLLLQGPSSAALRVPPLP